MGNTCSSVVTNDGAVPSTACPRSVCHSMDNERAVLASDMAPSLATQTNHQSISGTNVVNPLVAAGPSFHIPARRDRQRAQRGRFLPLRLATSQPGNATLNQVPNGTEEAVLYTSITCIQLSAQSNHSFGAVAGASDFTSPLGLSGRFIPAESPTTKFSDARKDFPPLSKKFVPHVAVVPPTMQLRELPSSDHESGRWAIRDLACTTQM
jgi:hypothetical protein